MKIKEYPKVDVSQYPELLNAISTIVSNGGIAEIKIELRKDNSKVLMVVENARRPRSAHTL